MGPIWRVALRRPEARSEGGPKVLDIALLLCRARPEFGGTHMLSADIAAVVHDKRLITAELGGRGPIHADQILGR